MGMMFVSSFVVTELVTLVSRSSVPESSISVPAILGISSLEWHEPPSEHLRSTITRIDKKMKIVDGVLFGVAFLIHAGLFAWAEEKLWLPLVDSANTSLLFQWISNIYGLSVLLLLLFSVIILAALRRTGRTALSNIVGRFLRGIFIAFLLWVFAPDQRRKTSSGTEHIAAPPEWLHKSATVCAVWIYLWGLQWLASKGIRWVCRRWPVVGRALLIGKREEGIVDSGTLDEKAWEIFCFFVGNLVVCVLWYAIVYDERGTVNPAWTDVFG
jgi:uncharacterized membrane protein YdcZ (DUF606 family)